MAFRQLSANCGGWIPNIDWTVGLGKWNRPDDVMLVQYMLNQLYGPHPKEGNPRLELPKGEFSFLKIDGIFGTHTQNFLIDYGYAKVEPSVAVNDVSTPSGADAFWSFAYGTGTVHQMQEKITLQLFPGNFILGNSLNKPIREKAKKFTQRRPS
jgi:hypothetical protein